DSDPHRTSLRAACHGPLRHSGDRPRVVRDLQHKERGRRSCARPREGDRSLQLMSALRELYQEVILDHNKSPRNYRKIANPTRMIEGFNRLCGDHYTLYVDLKGDVIADISFEGQGCAISKASASVMSSVVK